MKRCPQCNQTYTDDVLNFCMSDGTPLIAVSGEIPTVVLPRRERSRQGRGLMWAALIVFFIFATVALVGALLFFRSRSPEDQRTGVTIETKPTPASTPKPKASPSPTAAVAASPAETPAAETDEEQSSDEIVPIAWDTTAGGFKGEPGRTYKFQCPESGSPQGIWGSDVYADFSSVCTAAVHAGVITLEDGGVVTIEYRPGRPIYGTTTRHDIKSNTMGQHTRSFVVR